MKLHGHPQSSSCRKVLMAFAEKGHDVELVVVDLFARANRTPSHLELHPFGLVPVLEDGDFRLFESRAILRYLDGRLGPPSLVPNDARERARMDESMSVDQSYVAPNLRMLAIERLLRKRDGLPARADYVETAEQGLRDAFAAIDATLAKRTWLAGDTFTLADISLVPYVANLSLVGAAHVIERTPHVRAWWERASARPSWKKAVAPAS